MRFSNFSASPKYVNEELKHGATNLPAAGRDTKALRCTKL